MTDLTPVPPPEKVPLPASHVDFEGSGNVSVAGDVAGRDVVKTTTNVGYSAAMVQRLREAAKNGDSDIPVGNLSSRRDYTDVRDVVRAYRALVMSGVSGEVYNVASGVAQSMQETAELLRNLIAPGVDLRVDLSLVRPVDVPLLLGSSEKLQRATQWVPAISFATSLHDVINS